MSSTLMLLSCSISTSVSRHRIAQTSSTERASGHTLVLEAGAPEQDVHRVL